MHTIRCFCGLGKPVVQRSSGSSSSSVAPAAKACEAGPAVGFLSAGELPQPVVHKPCAVFPSLAQGQDLSSLVRAGCK